ncbi:MAG: hypothetical protein IKS76_02980, partial [Paludibacteraceae bacterium]|nr:hypothetical protein [Paludibacteraceae bacterium]
YTIIELSDIGLYVIRCMQTNKSFCKQTLMEISEVMDTPEKMQIVLSDIPTEGHSGYGYGYGYGYSGYGYGTSSYGYGYGRKRYGDKYRSAIYGKVFKRYAPRDSYNYYNDDEV